MGRALHRTEPHPRVIDQPRLGQETGYVDIAAAAREHCLGVKGDGTLVSWGGSIPVCERTAEALAEIGVNAELIDLRTIFPDQDEALASAIERKLI